MSKGAMLIDTTKNSEFGCAVCYSDHDDEIHEATLRIHRWFSGQVNRTFVEHALPVREVQPELAGF
jgi:hypothetical protein